MAIMMGVMTNMEVVRLKTIMEAMELHQGLAVTSKLVQVFHLVQPKERIN